MTLWARVVSTSKNIGLYRKSIFTMIQSDNVNLVISSIIFLCFFWIVDYYNLYTYKIDLKSIDVITYLSDTNSTTLDNTSINIHAIMEQIYMRNREWYFENYQNSTIIVTPIVQSRRNVLSIELLEGAYDFHSNKVIRNDSNSVGVIFKKSMNYNIFNLTQIKVSDFIYSHLVKFYDFNYLKDFKQFDTLRSLTEISNLGLLISSTCLGLSLALSYWFQHKREQLPKRLCIVLISFSFLAVIGFQLLNFSIVIIINSYYRNDYFTRSLLITLGQVLISIGFSYGYYFNCIDSSLVSWDDHQYPQSSTESENYNVKPEQSILLDTTGEQKSDTSSIYSDKSKPEEEKISTSCLSPGPNLLQVPYSGSIQSQSRSSTNPFQRNYTAPLPLVSPDSDSSGFEPLRRSMSARSPLFKYKKSSPNQPNITSNNFHPIPEVDVEVKKEDSN